MTDEVPRRGIAVVSLQPTYLPGSVFHLPLLWGTLRAYAEQDPTLAAAYAFQPPVWHIEALEAMLDRVGAPDVLAVSCYVWNQQNSHRLAAAVKARHPGCLVVYGGPNVPNRPSALFADHPWIDVAVHGEGEVPFAALLRERLSPAPDWERVPGISYRRRGVQRFTAPSKRLASLEFPSPFLSGYFDEVIAEIRANDPYTAIIAGLESTRGCPYSCAFCDWGMATMSKVRRFPPERIFEELDWVARNEVRVAWMHDANFGMFPHDVETTRFVARLKAKTGFPNVFYPLGYAKNSKDRTFEITKIIVDSGLDPYTDSVNFSLQTMGEATLRAVSRDNVPLKSYRALADLYGAAGYKLHPDLILPLPGETLDSFRAGYAELASWPQVARIQVYTATLLPNSPMAEPAYQAQWAIRTRRAPLGAGMEEPGGGLVEEIDAIVSTSTMSEADVVQAKVFVALARALELRGLLRSVRQYVSAQTGAPAWRFYAHLLDAQRRPRSLLAPTLERIEAAIEATRTEDELVRPWKVQAQDGTMLHYHKAIALSVLTSAPRFLDEVREALLSGWEIGPDAEVSALLRYQRDQWVCPGVDLWDPESRRFEYARDWPGYLASAGATPLSGHAIRVEYAAPSLWVNHRPDRSLDAWRRLVLMDHMAYDDHCWLGGEGRVVTAAG